MFSHVVVQGPLLWFSVLLPVRAMQLQNWLVFVQQLVHTYTNHDLAQAICKQTLLKPCDSTFGALCTDLGINNFREKKLSE